MELSCLRLFGAFRISVVMLGLSGTAFWSTLLTVLRTVPACSASSALMAVSTSAIISVESESESATTHSTIVIRVLSIHLFSFVNEVGFPSQ